MNTLQLILVLWTVYTFIQFPVIWIKVDPLHMKTYIAIMVFLFNLPGLLLWGIVHITLYATLSEDKRNKVVDSIERFYYSELD